jgi:glycine cleavage system protein P-like pyridoxal-binding family
MIQIKEAAEKDPEILKTAPQSTPVRRLDDALAVKWVKVRYIKE